MQTLGLTVAERGAFEKALRSSHTRIVKVHVLDLNGNVLSEISNVLLEGQVVVDQDAEVSRAATLSFLDPAHALSFDTNSPDDGALYADRMLRVTYSIYVEELGRHVDCVVFTGPVTKLDRAGDVVNVEAQSKEALVNGAIYRPLTLGKGGIITNAIIVLLRDRGGERSLAIEARTNRLPNAQSLDRWASIWETAKTFAQSLGMQLFYTGNGVATLRSWPGTPVYTFSEGDGGDVVSDLNVSYQISDVKNTIVVIGGVPKGKKARTYATAFPPADHALHPNRLGRTGNPRYLVEYIENPAFLSNAACLAHAKQVLDDRLLETVEVTFDSLPIPHLEPGDFVRVSTDAGTFSFRLKQFTIPLTSSGDPVMPVGYLKKTRLNRKRFRK